MLTFRREHGFTAVELMVTLSILAILSALALPSFQTFMAENRARGKTMELAAALQMAQSEALRRNREVVFAFTDSPRPVSALTASASGKGWATVALPLAGADTTSTREVVNVGGYTDGTADVTIDAPTAAVCFLPDGSIKANASTGITGATCSVDATGAAFVIVPSRGDKAWQVLVTPLGRIASCMGAVSAGVFTCS